MPWWLRYDVRSNEGEAWLVPTVPGMERQDSVEWRRVKSVQVFKRDLFTTDLICMVVVGGGSALEANEEMKGWKEFLSNAEQQLEGLESFETWFPKIMKPAFAENRRTVFGNEQPN